MCPGERISCTGRNWHGDVSRGSSTSVPSRAPTNFIAGRQRTARKIEATYMDRIAQTTTTSGLASQRCGRFFRKWVGETRSPRPKLTVGTHTASRMLSARVLM